MRRYVSLVSVILVLAAPHRSAHAQSHETAANAPAATHTPHWSYEGAEGPRAWGRLDSTWKTCTSGREQSPIDLGSTVAPRKARIDAHFNASPFVLFHNGHTVQAAIAKPSDLTVDGSRYSSLQFHFHHPSEHTVNGTAFPAELHLVHKNDRGERAVLGIFIAFAAEDNPLFEALIARLPKAAGDSVSFTTPVDVAALLDDRAGQTEDLFTYRGSLTTPPCSEGVKWTVRSRPIHASFRQIQKLVAVLGENARPAQSVFARR